MRRGTAGLLLALALLAAPVAAPAQPPARVARIGFLSSRPPLHEAFAQGLRELGHTDYHTFVIERRSGDGEMMRELAAELVRLEVDVIVADATAAARAAKRATQTIPIVVIAMTTRSGRGSWPAWPGPDRKSTRLNSSHIQKSRMPSSA